MASLNLAFKDFKNQASKIKNYEKLTITELANGYCEAMDSNSNKADQYFSALVLRFWYKISRAYQKNHNVLKVSMEDCYDWLIGAIMQACAKDARIWQKDSSVSAQAAINQVFSTRFEKMAYYESNLLKNKGAHSVISLDAPITEGDDENKTIGDLVADESSEIEKEGEASSFIQSLLDKNKVVEAIILDNIADAEKDVFRYKKRTVKETNSSGEAVKYEKKSSEFWPFKLMQELNDLDTEYVDYFLQRYNVSKEAFSAAMTVISKANNQKKYRMLRATLKNVKEDFYSYYIA